MKINEIQLNTGTTELKSWQLFIPLTTFNKNKVKIKWTIVNVTNDAIKMSSRVLKKLHGDKDLDILDQDVSDIDNDNSIIGPSGAQKKQFDNNRYDLVNWITNISGIEHRQNETIFSYTLDGNGIALPYGEIQER